jgi:hypothetical protein
MNDPFIDTLHSWNNFYFMIGGSAAGLVGLMFVAMSLGMSIVKQTSPTDFKLFVSPNMLYFISVLFISGLMLVPDHSRQGLAAALFMGGLVCFIPALKAGRGLIDIARRAGDFNIGDYLCQIIFPGLAYALLMLSALGFTSDQWPLSFTGLWIAVMLLLISAIFNTYSLVIWIFDQHKQ